MNALNLALQLQPISSSKKTMLKKAAALKALMDFYESDEGRETEDSETDLMIQLSGMVGGGALALGVE